MHYFPLEYYSEDIKKEALFFGTPMYLDEYGHIGEDGVIWPLFLQNDISQN